MIKTTQAHLPYWLTALFLLFFSNPHWAWASSPLPFFTAEYDADIKGFSVQASRQLKPLANGNYALIFEATSMMADLKESTEFSWQAEYIAPERYSYQRSILGKKYERVLTFDKQNQRITSTEKGRSHTIENPGKVLDNLSYQLQLQHDLLTSKTSLDYLVGDNKRIKERKFTIIGEETIDTKLGKLKTIKVELNHHTDKRVTYIWFAKDWHFLLARFEQYEEGKKDFVINITDAVINGNQISGF